MDLASATKGVGQMEAYSAMEVDEERDGGALLEGSVLQTRKAVPVDNRDQPSGSGSSAVDIVGSINGQAKAALNSGGAGYTSPSGYLPTSSSLGRAQDVDVDLDVVGRIVGAKRPLGGNGGKEGNVGIQGGVQGGVHMLLDSDDED